MPYPKEPCLGAGGGARVWLLRSAQAGAGCAWQDGECNDVGKSSLMGLQAQNWQYHRGEEELGWFYVSFRRRCPRHGQPGSPPVAGQAALPAQSGRARAPASVTKPKHDSDESRSVQCWGPRSSLFWP